MTNNVLIIQILIAGLCSKNCDEYTERDSVDKCMNAKYFYKVNIKNSVVNTGKNTEIKSNYVSDTKTYSHVKQFVGGFATNTDDLKFVKYFQQY